MHNTRGITAGQKPCFHFPQNEETARFLTKHTWLFYAVMCLSKREKKRFVFFCNFKKVKNSAKEWKVEMLHFRKLKQK